ncbi:MAG: murein L,D-transpeptidase [Alphaproteobacteria bacterium]|nr:murein L,D-transpeptidase [Alphaproteobacteria bacterium]
MRDMPFLRLLAAGALALSPPAAVFGQNAPAAREPAVSIAPQTASDSNALVFSTDTQLARPMVPAEDVAVAEQLQSLIETELARHVRHEADRAGIEAFYRSRGFAPIWVSKNAPAPRARDAMDHLKSVTADGLDPSDYPAPYFNDRSPYGLAADELFLTNTMLTFARHASTGRVAFTRVSASVYYDLKRPGAVEVLTRLSAATDIRAALDDFHPPHAGYKALKAELAAERARSGEAGNPARIADGPLLRPGADDNRVPLLRQRLGLAANGSQTYDDELQGAVKAFQDGNGLSPDGIVGAATLARLNGETREGRADVILANMERWRWMPRDLGESHVIVNVPDYSLKVVGRGTAAWSTRIVVGKPGTQATPLFTETMKFITVNPTWNVPPSIIRNEYLPALQRDPNALARIGLRMGRNADGSFRVYQPPGSRNALGRIRFNFPNRFLVFQHDTPDKHLFEKSERAFSHGCMRVQSPEKYAKALLSISQPQDGYTVERIESLYGANEHTIQLANPIPVHMTYQTAFVDDNGQLQIRRDIYGHDKAIADILRNERAVADVPVPRDYHSSSKPVMASTPQDDSFRDPLASFARGPAFGRQRASDRHTNNW